MTISAGEIQPTKRIQCKQCLTVAEIPEDTDPHAVQFCTCCTQTNENGDVHHHGEAAAACSPDQHGGEPCWNPPLVPKPDGCTVCRPLIHFATTNVFLAG
jgi:hypothetical protein